MALEAIHDELRARVKKFDEEPGDEAWLREQAAEIADLVSRHLSIPDSERLNDLETATRNYRNQVNALVPPDYPVPVLLPHSTLERARTLVEAVSSKTPEVPKADLAAVADEIVELPGFQAGAPQEPKDMSAHELRAALAVAGVPKDERKGDREELQAQLEKARAT